MAIKNRIRVYDKGSAPSIALSRSEIQRNHRQRKNNLTNQLIQRNRQLESLIGRLCEVMLAANDVVTIDTTQCATLNAEQCIDLLIGELTLPANSPWMWELPPEATQKGNAYGADI